MIFLTGATGFVGSRLALHLAKHNLTARCLVRDRQRAKSLQTLGFEVIVGDIRTPERFRQALAGCEQVVHLAAAIDRDPQLLDEVNHRGTASLVETAQRMSVKRFVHIGSFGAAPKQRFAYAYSEWQAEQCVRQSDLEWVILKPTVLVGRGDPFTGGLVHMARRWPFIVLPNKGKVRLQPLWVEDLVGYILDSLTSNAAIGQTLPLAGAQALSLRKITRHIMNACHARKPVLSAPRKALKAVYSFGRRWGIALPWNSAYFLSKDHVLSSESMAEMERIFPGHPHPFSAIVSEFIDG